jgi:hypothetical protein
MDNWAAISLSCALRHQTQHIHLAQSPRSLIRNGGVRLPWLKRRNSSSMPGKNGEMTASPCMAPAARPAASFERMFLQVALGAVLDGFKELFILVPHGQHDNHGGG